MARMLFVLIAVLLSCGVAACSDFSAGGKWHNNMKCTGGPLIQRCAMTEGEYLGLQIGMRKREAFESVCRGEAGRYLVNGVFEKDETTRTNAGGKVDCGYLNDALAADSWSFDKAGDLHRGAVFIYFTNGAIKKIGYSWEFAI